LTIEAIAQVPFANHGWLVWLGETLEDFWDNEFVK
jgi:hypothetical protein